MERPTGPDARPPESPADRHAQAKKRHLRALRDLLIRIGALALVLYVLLVHLVGVTVMPNADMYPRVDMGDLVIFYRLERNIRAGDLVVFRKPTASLEASYWAEEAVAEREAAPEKNFFRRALDWLGFPDPADEPSTLFVCRVAARPGDTVAISESERLIVNGNTVMETGIFYPTPEYAGFVTYPLQLGEDEYFVLADYRSGGADSRFFGPVRLKEIEGTVITIMRRNHL